MICDWYTVNENKSHNVLLIVVKNRSRLVAIFVGTILVAISGTTFSAVLTGCSESRIFSHTISVAHILVLQSNEYGQ